MNNIIFKTLKDLRLSSEKTRNIYAAKTRDMENLTVWKDETSGVIFIDDYYAGDNEYQSGLYRKDEVPLTGQPDFDQKRDADRRAAKYEQFYIGKNICDFGCGSGDFLHRARSTCKSINAVELQQSYYESLNTAGIPCHKELKTIADSSLDTLFSFHVLEHLPDPLASLSEMWGKLKNGGMIIIEVPHAGDFLLRDDIECNNFKEFTLWSQHLVLHTRHSLKTFLKHSGFSNIIIEGVQRYSLANHMTWLTKGKPGGHRTPISVFEHPMLHNHYEAALNKIDATDTLVAIATKQGLHNNK